VGSFPVAALGAALPDLPLDEFVRYAERQIVPILPDSPPRFVNLNQYLWSERWLERYQEMDFIQRVLNGMASRRPRLEALRDSWQDLDTHYDRWRGSSGAFIRR
jgi:acyl carrier protein phosphodiesterase